MRGATRCFGRSIQFLLAAVPAFLAQGTVATAGDEPSAPAVKLEAASQDEIERQQRLIEEQVAAQQRAVEKQLREDPAWKPSHVQTGVIHVSPAPKDDFVHTFCLDQDGNLLVGCGGTREITEVKDGKPATRTESDPRELRVYSPEGRLLKTLKVETEPQAVCVLPDGTIFVGGEGKLLKLDGEGKVLAQAPLPSLQEKKPAKNGEGKTESKTGDDANAPALEAARQRLRRVVTGLAVTDTEVFVATLGSQGWGYSVWRLDHDFQQPKEVITGLTGCCGQMDVQAAAGDLWIPENGRHRVSRYDREGKKLADFGKQDRKAADGFGGCCEPKNLSIGPGGDVFTAESGEPVVVKRFSPDGKFRGVVALPKYKTGCVRVCVAAAQDGRIFILNPGEGAIHVFGDRTKFPTHQFVRMFGINGDGSPPAQLNSFCLDAQGNVLAACAEANGKGDIRVLNPEGKVLTTYALSFVPQAVNRAADGTIYTAGSGRMAHLDAKGKLLKEENLPSDVKGLLPEEVKKLQAELKKLQTNNAKLFSEYGKLQMDLVKSQRELSDANLEADSALTDAEKKAGADLIAKASARYKQAEAKFTSKVPEVQKASQAMQAIYAKIGVPGMRGAVTGIAATKRDLFIARQPDAGYGYEVWRTDHEFGNAKKIITGLAGCCGQMDVQADGDEVWIPENGRHQVHRYDRDGKMISTFGKNDRSAPDGFGGCCEPKNIRIVGDEIFTAESTQPVEIKHFGKDGRFLGIVAVPTYKTGCVRVCLEVSADRQQVYCLSPGDNSIYVFRQGEAGEGGVIPTSTTGAGGADCKDGNCKDGCKDDKCKDGAATAAKAPDTNLPAPKAKDSKP
jgi:hypothetical protein